MSACGMKKSGFYDASASPRTEIFLQFHFPMQSTTTSIILHECVSTALSQKQTYAVTCMLYSRVVSLLCATCLQMRKRGKDSRLAKPHVIVVLHRFHFATIFPFGTFLFASLLHSDFPRHFFFVALQHHCFFFVSWRLRLPNIHDSVQYIAQR